MYIYFLLFFTSNTHSLGNVYTFTLLTWVFSLSETGVLPVGVDGWTVALIVSVQTVTHSPKHG